MGFCFCQRNYQDLIHTSFRSFSRAFNVSLWIQQAMWRKGIHNSTTNVYTSKTMLCTAERIYVPSELQDLVSCYHKSNEEIIHVLVYVVPEALYSKHRLGLPCSILQNMFSPVCPIGHQWNMSMSLNLQTVIGKA